MKKKILLIGARGVGKTSLAGRWPADHRPVDLDEEICSRFQRGIDEFFAQGESTFRQAEHEVLRDLLLRPEPLVIAVGAGFLWSDWTWPVDRESVEVIWLRRSSDEEGRIFLDRPRLSRNPDPLAEFGERHRLRFTEYARVSDWTYWVPEGLFSSSAEESLVLQGKGDRPCFLTIHPDRGFSSRNRWPFVTPEIRDDLWSDSRILEWKDRVLQEKRSLLVSFRKRRSPGEVGPLMNALRGFEVDWDVHELGPPSPDWPVTILSSHGDHPPDGPRHLKWSPRVDKFSDLQRGWDWQQADPSNRSFLPRSQDGRWNWFRQWMQGRQKLNFLRDEIAGILDQPTLHEWLRGVPAAGSFAAVLGDPVKHSWSPTTHLDFFKVKKMPFFAIAIREEEWEEAFAFLEHLGLEAAAVTSPLKRLAFEKAREKDSLCRELASANTLTRTAEAWRADNTDLQGFTEALTCLGSMPEPVAVWGGGGTLPILVKALPRAVFYSARTGRPREGEEISPATLVWAASAEAAAPEKGWRPRRVIDLNYRSDSRVREFARVQGAEYISGASMFFSQARAQQEIWSRFFK